MSRKILASAMVLSLLGLGMVIAWPWRGANTFWLVVASGALVVATGVLGFFVGDEIKRLRLKQFQMSAGTVALGVLLAGLVVGHLVLLAPMAEAAPGLPFPHLSVLVLAVAVGATAIHRSQ